MNIRVYNTLTRRKERFPTPDRGLIGMYVCGPTVYKPSHVGHMVGPVVFDTIKRFLSYCGYKVKLVINITDIDDKLIIESGKREMTVQALASEITADYLKCLEMLEVKGVDCFPRATDHISEITDMISGLIKKGHAYPADGDVYFDVTSDSDYGKLCNRDPEQLEAGARIEISKKKKNPGDFALWKAAKPGEPFWPSPWGDGRPGWHIECSAMSMKHLGETIDIHGGGLDLQFPHHENELAQSESFTGKPFAKFWLHNGLMKTGEKKMSKSEGNEIVVTSLLRKHRPEVLRCLLLSTHYRSPIEYTNDRLMEIKKSLGNFYRFFDRYQRITGNSYYVLPFSNNQFVSNQDFVECRNKFLEFLADDFNTSGALGVLHEILAIVNRYAEVGKLESNPDKELLATFEQGCKILRELSNILGIFQNESSNENVTDDDIVGPLIDLLIEMRNEARKNKNFTLADRIRDRLAELRIIIEDRSSSSGWRRE